MPYYRSLIGVLNGSIIVLSKDLGDSGVANGTHALVTEEEVLQAGLMANENTKPIAAELLPSGWKCAPAPEGGFILFGPGQDQIREEPFPNLAAARSFAHNKVHELNSASALANGTTLPAKNSNSDTEKDSAISQEESAVNDAIGDDNSGSQRFGKKK